MPALESLKKGIERVTGLWRPTHAQLRNIRRRVPPKLLKFASDGKTPNNPALPVIVYPGAVLFYAFDPAAVFEVLFASNGWTDSWRDGMYPYAHFHSATHEVLGIARGTVRARLGGTQGKDIDLEAGDVLVLPAGTGHKRIRASSDLLVVGAYPAGGSYDEPRSGRRAHDEAREKIVAVPMPAKDPVYGARGPLRALWRGGWGTRIRT